VARVVENEANLPFSTVICEQITGSRDAANALRSLGRREAPDGPSFKASRTSPAHPNPLPRAGISARQMRQRALAIADARRAVAWRLRILNDRK